MRSRREDGIKRGTDRLSYMPGARKAVGVKDGSKKEVKKKGKGVGKEGGLRIKMEDEGMPLFMLYSNFNVYLH